MRPNLRRPFKEKGRQGSSDDDGIAALAILKLGRTGRFALPGLESSVRGISVASLRSEPEHGCKLETGPPPFDFGVTSRIPVLRVTQRCGLVGGGTGYDLKRNVTADYLDNIWGQVTIIRQVLELVGAGGKGWDLKRNCFQLQFRAGVHFDPGDVGILLFDNT